MRAERQEKFSHKMAVKIIQCKWKFLMAWQFFIKLANIQLNEYLFGGSQVHMTNEDGQTD
jgi:hypothetical protein